MGWVLISHGVAATQIEDASFVKVVHPVIPNVSYWLTGLNDMRNYGTNAIGQQQYQDTLYALASYLTVAQSSKVLASASTTVGSWTTSAVYTNMGLSTSTGGDTLTATVTGTVLYIVSVESASGGSFTITVDGASKGTFSTKRWALNGGNGTTTGLYRVRIGGLSNTAHVVVVTAVGDGPIDVQWLGGLPGVSNTAWPKLWLGNCLHMSTAGYGSGGAGWINGSDTAVGQFNAVIAQVSTDLALDGLNIYPVDASAVFNPLTDVFTDNVHPNDFGHAKIAEAFVKVMQGGGLSLGAQRLTIPVAAAGGVTSAAMGGSALTAGQCVTANISVPTASLGQTVLVSPNGIYPGDGFTWSGWVSGANIVQVKLCALVAGTPTAAFYSARILP
jgi:hypothetical protein